MTVSYWGEVTVRLEAGLSTTATTTFGIWDESEWDEAFWGPDVVWTDITDYLRRGQTFRGRQRTLDQFAPGTATFVLSNSDGRFSPTNLGGAYASNGISKIRPGVPIRLFVDANQVFFGFAQRWDEGFAPGGFDPIVTVSLYDGLGLLGRYDGFATESQGGGERAGERITRILGNAGWAWGTNAQLGKNTMQATTLEGNALALLQLTAHSEGGAVYVDRDGTLRFDEQYYTIETSTSANPQATFADADAVPNGVNLPGSAGNYVSTPDAASLDITGDIDIRVRVAPTDWTPTADQTLISKWLTTGNQRSWSFVLENTGALTLFWSTAGTGASVLSATSTDEVTFDASTARWARVTMDVDDGAGNRVINFSLSADALMWTPLGTTITTAGTTSIFSGTATVNIGAQNAGASSPFAGVVYRAEIRSAIDATVVASPDFRADPASATSTTLVDAQGLTWTINGTAALRSQAAFRYVDITPAFGDDLIRNFVTYSRVGGSPQTVDDNASRALHGDRPHRREDLICETDAQAKGLAGLMVQRYAQPEKRVDSFTVKPRGNADLWAQALGRRLRDRIIVAEKLTSGDRFFEELLIEGIAHSFDPSEWVTTFYTGAGDAYAFAAWDRALWDDPAAIFAY